MKLTFQIACCPLLCSGTGPRPGVKRRWDNDGSTRTEVNSDDDIVQALPGPCPAARKKATPKQNGGGSRISSVLGSMDSVFEYFSPGKGQTRERPDDVNVIAQIPLVHGWIGMQKLSNCPGKMELRVLNRPGDDATYPRIEVVPIAEGSAGSEPAAVISIDQGKMTEFNFYEAQPGDTTPSFVAIATIDNTRSTTGYRSSEMVLSYRPGEVLSIFDSGSAFVLLIVDSSSLGDGALAFQLESITDAFLTAPGTARERLFRVDFWEPGRGSDIDPRSKYLVAYTAQTVAAPEPRSRTRASPPEPQQRRITDAFGRAGGSSLDVVDVDAEDEPLPKRKKRGRTKKKWAEAGCWSDDGSDDGGGIGRYGYGNDLGGFIVADGTDEPRSKGRKPPAGGCRDHRPGKSNSDGDSEGFYVPEHKQAKAKAKAKTKAKAKAGGARRGRDGGGGVSSDYTSEGELPDQRTNVRLERITKDHRPPNEKKPSVPRKVAGASKRAVGMAGAMGGSSKKWDQLGGDDRGDSGCCYRADAAKSGGSDSDTDDFEEPWTKGSEAARPPVPRRDRPPTRSAASAAASAAAAAAASAASAAAEQLEDHLEENLGLLDDHDPCLRKARLGLLRAHRAGC